MINRRGQSIIELVIAMAIGVILLVGGVSAIVPILKISGNVARIQTASALGKELLENARVLAASDWHALDSLSTSSASHYYVNASSSPFTFATGTESVIVSTTTYTRWLYLDNVYRNTTTPFEPGVDGGDYDPSTKKITVVYTWPPDASNTIVSYLTRSTDDVLFNNDWTGGPDQDGPLTVTSTNNRFSSSSNIDYTGTPGSVVITGF
jgi:hypothetical protein